MSLGADRPLTLNLVLTDPVDYKWDHPDLPASDLHIAETAGSCDDLCSVSI